MHSNQKGINFTYLEKGYLRKEPLLSNGLHVDLGGRYYRLIVWQRRGGSGN